VDEKGKRGVIWQEINEVCTSVHNNSTYEARLTKKPAHFLIDGKLENRFWVIGEYEGDTNTSLPGLTTLAIDLRNANSVARQNNLFDQTCFGMRYTDVSPSTAERPAPGGIRKARNEPWDVSQADLDKLIALRKDGSGNKDPRQTDKWNAVADYYSKTTLGAHHIVEKSILRNLGLNKGDLSDNIAPSVLVHAELHSLFSRKVTQAERDSYVNLKDNLNFAAIKLTDLYNEMYASPQTAPLLEIAKIIIKQVKQGKFK